MNNLLFFSKYYLQGFVLASAIGCIFILHSLFIDDTYSFIDFSLYMQVNSIMAVFLGLHLFIMKYIDQPHQIKNPYLRSFYTIFACYWLGIIFCFIVFSLIYILKTLIKLNFLNFINEYNLLQISLIIALPFAIYSKSCLNKFNSF